MAQYKVPQDVEADDKLIGPFTFRQFIYLLIVAGLCAVTWALFQLFPALAIIPLPLILLFGTLALPIKKDQPMETYLSAIVSFYLKPNKRFWNPGQRESTILITAPKVVEQSRARNITGSEASHRLSFLADLVDSEGRSIKDGGGANMREEFVAEANSATDIFEAPIADNLSRAIANETASHHAAVVNRMKAAIEQNNNLSMENASVSRHAPKVKDSKTVAPVASVVVQPEIIHGSSSDNKSNINPSEETLGGYGRERRTAAARNDGPAERPVPKMDDIAFKSKKNNDEVFISLR